MRLTKTFRGEKKLHTTKHTLIKPRDGYARPKMGFDTSTTIWHVDELIKRRVRDWMRLLGEDGYSGQRESVARKDLTIYTGTYSVFPVPLVEYIMMRYGGEPGSVILDPFAGGPPRGLACGIMGYIYHGYDVNKDQIKTNQLACQNHDVPNVYFHHGDARYFYDDGDDREYDMSITCPPYYDLEVYSDQEDDLSTFKSYGDFDDAMKLVPRQMIQCLKPGAFVCIVVANFRDKKTGDLIDFRGHTVENFLDAGFVFWQDVILCKNFGSAAKRASNAWKGQKLVPRHEHLLVFAKPKNKNGRSRL